MNFIYSLIAKFVGPKFIIKHVTTLIGMLSGLILGFVAKNNISIDPVILEQFFSSSKEIIVAIALYLLSLVIDAKPETPKVIKE